MAVPRLRFKGVKGNWDRKKLNVLFDKITTKNILGKCDNVISNSAQYGLVSQRNFFLKDIANAENTSNYYVIEHDDFVYNPRKSKEAPYGPFNRYMCKDTGIVSPLYTCLRRKSLDNLDFLMFYFKSGMWHRYMYSNGNTGVRHDRVSVTDDILMKLPVSLPHIDEQQKIADFLTTFDKRIAVQQNIIADLEETKKGLLQKIFSQEIRFKDDNGQEFPSWEKKKIKDLGEIVTGNTPSTNIKDYYENGDILWVTPSDINDEMYIFNTERKLTNLGIKKARFLPKGSVLITCIASIGKMTILGEDGSCNQQINAIIPSNDNDSIFILSMMRTLVPVMFIYAGKTATPILNKETFSRIKCCVPCLEEQQKIAAFLSTFDKKITAEKQILSDLKEIKKGLLQQMFV